MFKDVIKSQVVGTLKIYDKESGEVLVQKKECNSSRKYGICIGFGLWAGKTTSVNSSGSAPHINWMQFGKGGSTSTTTLSYRSPRVYPTYDQLAITASNSSLYEPKYEQDDNEHSVLSRRGHGGWSNSTKQYSKSKI